MEECNFAFDREKKQNNENYQDGHYHILYRWLDKIPFSKRPKTLARDFSDGGEYTFFSELKNNNNTFVLFV